MRWLHGAPVIYIHCKDTYFAKHFKCSHKYCIFVAEMFIVYSKERQKEVFHFLESIGSMNW